MKRFNNIIGTYGEEISQDLLIKRGHVILEKNFKCKLGEIDIISSINNANCICFIEVKSRFNTSYGMPLEAVTYSKIKKIRKAAEYYINKNKLFEYEFRFDVIEVFLDRKSDDFSINVIENAF
ncbi:hypothetical protein CLHOM_11490 [Clostridium homopropionicum DSM 5847]|uniref:UPF0102 protein CLHOM_11490 n=1 Tax=Clostridium homopropionicum DSM 5847 TaxID=1121318 RepID=A0A0L6ZC70_9CLOT|nr:YraN family protein [Clostridium homopropionicum]KOA20561.1 hypothetical protein CLHOM_11490 [Clostridium homopropionicum DSM 5847]SFG38869.1 putative endonuclease [Clostridium homopropionicum]